MHLPPTYPHLPLGPQAWRCLSLPNATCVLSPLAPLAPQAPLAPKAPPLPTQARAAEG